MRCPEHCSEMTNGNGSRMYTLAKPPNCGVTAKDNRLFIEAVLWIARTDSPWRDLALGQERRVTTDHRGDLP